jgi:hypothetical protein
VAQTMYTHVSKCKNDKMRKGKKKNSFRKQLGTLKTVGVVLPVCNTST